MTSPDYLRMEKSVGTEKCTIASFYTLEESLIASFDCTSSIYVRIFKLIRLAMKRVKDVN